MFQVIWGTRKKIFSNKFLPEAISPSAKNSMILTSPYSRVSSAIYNLFFIRVTPIYREHVQKSLNVNDTWFGFYSNFKKGTLHVHMNNAGVNGLSNICLVDLTILSHVPAS